MKTILLSISPYLNQWFDYGNFLGIRFSSKSLATSTRQIFVQNSTIWRKFCCHKFQVQNIRKNWTNWYTNITSDSFINNLTTVYYLFFLFFHVFTDCWCSGAFRMLAIFNFFKATSWTLIPLVNITEYYLIYSILIAKFKKNPHNKERIASIRLIQQAK